MKKLSFLILISSLLVFTLIGCSNSASEENPGEVTINFLKALQQQNYSSVKQYYTENIDNLSNFKNKIESISPHVANELFGKMAEFDYTIDKVEISSEDPNKAIVTVTMKCYDLGKAFESTILEYTKTDLEMTFDGSKNEEILKKAEETIMTDINNSEQSFIKTVPVYLTKKDESWKVDTLSKSSEFLNALSGNILNTIDEISQSISELQ